MTNETAHLIEADIVALARTAQAELSRCTDAADQVTLLRKRNAHLQLLRLVRATQGEGERHV